MPDISDEEARENAFLSNKEIAGMKGYLHASRRVFVSGTLTEKSLKRATLELIKLDFEKTEPILMLLESAGGDVVATQQFYDAISLMNSPVDVLAIGDCCSMAADLVQVCRRRMLMPGVRMLLHYIRASQPWIADDPARLEVDLNYFRQSMSEIRESRFALYEKRTNLSRERLEELFRHGEVHKAYFSAKQAIELGLADEIVTDFKLFPRKVAEEKK
jgi:ATP-dependent protease ClpP protease subunit